MNIVVLDGCTLNPGDLSWERLEALGPCSFHDRTPPDQVVERSRQAHVVLTNKVVFSRPVLAQLPDLKYIGVTATGYNMVDLAAARERGIPVTNVPTYGTPAVAQMTFAHLLNLCQRVAHHSQTVQSGRWSRSIDFCYWDFPLVELAGLTMGVVGLGRIGRSVAHLARAFGMQVLGYDVAVPSPPPEGIALADLDTLFRQSDVVTLHCPLTDENRGFVSTRLLSLMKPTAFLINTSRGPLVDERTLAQALNQGRIAGAGLDVLEREPPPADCPLLSAKNCFITPHIAWATRAARQRLLDIAIDNVAAFVRGQPQNVVN